MTSIVVLSSIIVGSISGIIYSLVFFTQEKQGFVFKVGEKKPPLLLFLFFRFGLLTLFLRHILLYTIINPILFVVSFLVSWWCVILSKGM